MKPDQQHKLTRFFLRIIDVFVALYLPRSIRWNEEPFQRATSKQWRLGWLFVAGMPIVMTIAMTNGHVQTFLDSAGTPEHSVVWLYVAFIGLVLVGGLVWLRIGPQIPLFVSIPVAVISWAICLYVGWHPEKFLHNPW